MNIWTVYERKPGGTAGSRLIVFARRDTPPDPLDLYFGLLSDAIRNRVIDAAGQLASQRASLTAAVVHRSECLGRTLKREPESLIVRYLSEWLKSSAQAPSAQRAAALLVADAYISCARAQVPAEVFAPLGAKLVNSCP